MLSLIVPRLFELVGVPARMTEPFTQLLKDSVHFAATAHSRSLRTATAGNSATVGHVCRTMITAGLRV